MKEILIVLFFVIIIICCVFGLIKLESYLNRTKKRYTKDEDNNSIYDWIGNDRIINVRKLNQKFKIKRDFVPLPEHLGNKRLIVPDTSFLIDMAKCLMKGWNNNYEKAAQKLLRELNSVKWSYNNETVILNGILVVPKVVYRQLDGLKKATDDRRILAHKAGSFLNYLRNQGYIYFDWRNVILKKPWGILDSKIDEDIIYYCLFLKKLKYNVSLLTLDENQAQLAKEKKIYVIVIEPYKF